MILLCFFLFSWRIIAEWMEGKTTRSFSGMRSQQILIQKKKPQTLALVVRSKLMGTSMRWEIETVK